MKTKTLTIVSLLLILSMNLLAEKKTWHEQKQSMLSSLVGEERNASEYVKTLNAIVGLDKGQEKEAKKIYKDYQKGLKQILLSGSSVQVDRVAISNLQSGLKLKINAILTEEQILIKEQYYKDRQEAFENARKEKIAAAEQNDNIE